MLYPVRESCFVVSRRSLYMVITSVPPQDKRKVAHGCAHGSGAVHGCASVILGMYLGQPAVCSSVHLGSPLYRLEIEIEGGGRTAMPRI